MCPISLPVADGNDQKSSSKAAVLLAASRRAQPLLTRGAYCQYVRTKLRERPILKGGPFIFKISLGRKSPYCTALWIQNKRDELASGKFPYHTKGGGTLLTIFKLNEHGSLGRHPHLLLNTSKGFMPNDDGMLA